MTTRKESNVNSGSKIAMSLDLNTYFLTCNDIIELSRATLSTKVIIFKLIFNDTQNMCADSIVLH